MALSVHGLEIVISFFFNLVSWSDIEFLSTKGKEKFLLWTHLKETDLEIAMRRKVTPNTPYYAWF